MQLIVSNYFKLDTHNQLLASVCIELNDIIIYMKTVDHLLGRKNILRRTLFRVFDDSLQHNRRDLRRESVLTNTACKTHQLCGLREAQSGG